jgi:hypothetical protein
LDLIHMNGRVQDPVLGRFLSPDPLVQAPYHLQSLNRYSYVWNNPLSLVDPSGFQAEEGEEEENASAGECVVGRWENCTEAQMEALCRQMQIDTCYTVTPSSGGSTPGVRSYSYDRGYSWQGGATPQGAPPPSWMQTSGVCLGGCHGTTPAGEFRQMTPTEEFILHAGAAIVTLPIGGEFAILVRAGLTARVIVPSSRALGRALEAAGHARPAGSAAHHIVAGNAPAAAQARAVLQRFGIGINDAINGVFLPATRAAPNATGAAAHSTVHTNAYYQTVNQMLGAATTRAEAEAALRAISQALLAGGL